MLFDIALVDGVLAIDVAGPCRVNIVPGRIWGGKITLDVTAPGAPVTDLRDKEPVEDLLDPYDLW